MIPRKRRLPRAGFSLVEMMIVVAMTGVLAVLAVYGIRKYIANARSTEARNSLGLITKHAQMAIEGGLDRQQGSAQTALQNVGTIGRVDQNVRSLCPSAAAVPLAVPKAMKYQSAPNDWSGDPGWKCLQFQLAEPQYYQYNYTAVNTSIATGSFTTAAYGDLNGDGVNSTFMMGGTMNGGNLLMSTLAETNPEE